RTRGGDLVARAAHRRGAVGLLRTADDQDRGSAMSTVTPAAPVSVAPATRVRAGALSRRGRRRKLRRAAWNVLGLVVFVVLIFPVFWMFSTAFKPDDEISSFTPTWFSLHPTLEHFRDAIDPQQHPYFWDGVKNSLIVVGGTVTVSIGLAFLAA